MWRWIYTIPYASVRTQTCICWLLLSLALLHTFHQQRSGVPWWLPCAPSSQHSFHSHHTRSIKLEWGKGVEGIFNTNRLGVWRPLPYHTQGWCLVPVGYLNQSFSEKKLQKSAGEKATLVVIQPENFAQPSRNIHSLFQWNKFLPCGKGRHN